MTELEKKVLDFCEKEFDGKLQVFFHDDYFTVERNGEFWATIFYYEI